MKDEMKVGIVGAPRGSGFVRAIQTVTETRLTAICDINKEVLEARAKQFGIEETYTDFQEMADSDLDIIIVATPMPLHVPQAVMALEKGKHVLTEVPAATDLEQCWRLLQAVKNTVSGNRQKDRQTSKKHKNEADLFISEGREDESRRNQAYNCSTGFDRQNRLTR